MTNNAEGKVMDIFRFYGVLPYQMLCLNPKVQQDYRGPLDRLIQKGLVVREDRHGGYHLTSSGYAAVNQPREVE